MATNMAYTNRTQKVAMEGETSNCETLKFLSGVLQGTFLRPLMFPL